MPKELSRLQKLLRNGLDKTAGLWPAIRKAYSWVHRAAHLLNNEAGQHVLLLKSAYQALLAEMVREQASLGRLGPAVEVFRRVTASYWPGLFCSYERGEIPRTNNDLEQLFGSVRYHERRSSGRKVGAPGLVVRGRARLVASVVSRSQQLTIADLRPHNLEQWRELRAEVAQRHEGRRQQLRFRRDPAAYLQQLENLLLKTSLPT